MISFSGMILLKFAGIVQYIVNDHMIIAKCDAAQLPPLHTEIIDRRHRKAGKLVEIFGNIRSPYALIWCEKPGKRIAGEKLYTK